MYLHGARFWVPVLAVWTAFAAPLARGDSSCAFRPGATLTVVDDTVPWPGQGDPVPYPIRVLNNDVGTGLRIASVSSPGNRGTVTWTADCVYFTPAPNRSGAKFAYQVVDASGATAQAVVHVGTGDPGPSLSASARWSNLDGYFTMQPEPAWGIVRYHWTIRRYHPTVPQPPLVDRDWGAGSTVFHHGFPDRNTTYDIEVSALYTSGETAAFKFTNYAVPPAQGSVKFTLATAQAPYSGGKNVPIRITQATWNAAAPADLLSVATSENANIQIHWGDHYPVQCLAASGTAYVGAGTSHLYEKSGTYTITTTLRSLSGVPCAQQTGPGESFSQTIEVTNSAPVAAITATAGAGGREYQLGGEESRDEWGGVLRYLWSFEDGTEASGRLVTHRFPVGSNDVRLTVTDDEGAVGTATHTIDVENAPPAASFWIDCTAGRNCLLEAGQSADPDGSVVEYRWSAAGREWSADLARTHVTFPQDGRHVVTLAAVDDHGDVSPTVSRVVHVNSAPRPAPLLFYPLAPCRAYNSVTLASPLTSGVRRKVPITGKCGVPPDAAAVEANLTVTQPAAAGHLQAFPSDAPVPATSVMNFAANDTRANNAAVDLAGGAIDLLAGLSGPAGSTVHALVDVHGYWRARPVDITADSGLYLWRGFDGRPRVCRPWLTQALQANTTVPFDAGACPGSTELGAAFVRLRLTNATAPGHVTMWRIGTNMPATSTMNLASARPIANGGFVAAGSGGFDGINVRYATGTAATGIAEADLMYFAPAGSTNDRDAYFPVPSCRLMDTRNAQFGGARSSGSAALYLHGNCGIPANASAVRANVIVIAPQSNTTIKDFTYRLAFALAGETIATGTVFSLKRFPSAVAERGHYQGASILSSTDAAGQAVPADFVVDVLGYWAPAASSTSVAATEE